MSENQLEPCSWAQGELYLDYHNNEWGIPCYEPHSLFEKICLEGQQAGLSWITVLKKRENYRKQFYQFDPEKVAQMTPQDIDERMQDTGLIRHRGKLEAIVKNANAWVSQEEQGVNMVQWFWDHVDNKVIVNRFKSISEAPAQTDISKAMSKSLKKMGFVFVGPTTCYAFMQAMGMVNDHLISCPCHPDNCKSDNQQQDNS